MSRIVACPHCSTRLRVSDQITDKTLLCPRCLANLDNPEPGFQIRAADINTDVKRDVNVASRGLAVLIGLCVLGIVLVFNLPLYHTGYGEAGIALLLMLFFFAALDVLVSIVIVRGMLRADNAGIPSPSAGRVLGIVFLSLGTIVAVCIFFFFTCLGLLSLKSL